MSDINAWAATQEGEKLKPYTYTPGALARDEVEVEVLSCGLCHSDLSIINNDWGISRYPLVPGHEIVGKIIAMGENVTHLSMGQTVGIGWIAGSCLTCTQCMSGKHQRCAKGQPTILGHQGGFADRARAQAIWAIPIPKGVSPKDAGPLMCGGITVFTPLIDYGVQPTDRVAVIGIGGLGHLAIKFLKAWGCEVTALTTSMDKEVQLKEMGAHQVINTKDTDKLASLSGKFDFILSTVNASLPWHNYLAALAPAGRLVTVGLIDEPMPIKAGQLVMGGKSIGGSDTGTPAIIAKMLEFCARHNIKPDIEVFSMDKVNEAIEHLKAGKARYRVVLTR